MTDQGIDDLIFPGKIDLLLSSGMQMYLFERNYLYNTNWVSQSVFAIIILMNDLLVFSPK